MISILVTGSDGQLGTELRLLSSEYPFKMIFTDVADLNITDKNALHTFFSKQAFDYIINCAAYTAVDKAESDMQAADRVNHLAPGILAEFAHDKKSRLIHMSTDYVFNGNSCLPYREDDKTAPDTVYGHTKLDGEKAVAASGADYMIIRTSWLYSPFGHNFVKTMIRLGQENESLNVVYDQVGSPTSARDLARGVLEIIDKVSSGIYPFVSGIFHFSNEGVCSWYDFAVAVHKLAGIECAVHPIDTEKYPAPAKRPHYSVLNKQKIKAAYDLEIPHWETSLELIINRILNP